MFYDEDEKIFSFLATKKRDLVIQTSMDAYEKIYPFYNFGIFANHIEKFFAVLLDQEQKPIEYMRVSSRQEPFVQVDIGGILDKVKTVSATSIVLSRSSVSNNTKPTDQDTHLVKVIAEECAKQNLKLQDYLIISEYGMYFSFADQIWKTQNQINHQ